MWKARSLPPVRPITIGEIKAGLSIRVMKGIVQGERSGCLVQLQQVKARL